MRKKAYYIEELYVADVFTIENGQQISLEGKRIIYTVCEFKKKQMHLFGKIKAYITEDYTRKYYIYPERKEVFMEPKQEQLKEGSFLAYNIERGMEKLDDYFVTKGILYDEDLAYCYNALNGITELDNLTRLKKGRDDVSGSNN